ncbi:MULTISPECIES: LysR family transcriptional regulator [unclassified Caballeronia]|uniref:LysR family transcriptional regulator n=1 Tax=unclassified Caballeronia TaxID=2646786 RepID=UPI00285CAC40|nr:MULTISPECIES: LysR family transcriptional regulator [unclassified Caballeronia]MDR5752128.1 LysR family transcriptional regulator [Caballeronia sp. LZ024]MDR5843731.1 LysR family transcriptional regulator [Caballeronia sp. LZ031]
MAQSYSNWFVRARLKTRQLLLLAAMEEEGNVRRAADVLGMTQPAASRLLKELEDVLDVRLFDRTPHGMHATLYGEVMIRHARMVLSNLSQAHDEISALRSGLVGQVQIGSIATAAATMVPVAISRVKERYPHLQIWLQVETSDVMLPRVAEGELDIMIGRVLERQGQFKDAVRYEPLAADEPLCVVARPGHPMELATGLTLRGIVNASWVLHPPGSVLRHRFDLAFSQIGLNPPQNVVNTNNFLAISSLLLQSDMLAVVPAEVAQQYEESGVLKRVAIDLPCRMDAFGIITRQTQLLSPAATVMLNALRDAATEVYGTSFDLSSA